MSDDNLQVVSSEILDAVQGEQKSLAVSQLVDGSIVKQPPSIRASLGLAETGPVELVRIYGTVTGLTEEKELPAQDGRPARKTWGLKGVFEAANIMTGELLQGTEYYLPDGFHERRVNEVRDAMRSSKEVAIEVVHAWTAFQTKSPSGYSWRLYEPRPQTADRLAETRRKALTFRTTPQLLELGLSGEVLTETKHLTVLDGAAK